MDSFFTFFQIYRNGILLFLFGLAVIVAIVQWLAWIFSMGRFGKDMPSGSKALSVAFSEFIFKIINEFRHLLALLVFTVFSFALAYSLIKAASLPTNPDAALLPTDPPSVINNMKEALQGVMATLGGLVGSIIGYYFGESSAGKGTSTTAATDATKPQPEIQDPPVETNPSATITKIEKPPTK
jgi:hypothetical protein